MNVITAAQLTANQLTFVPVADQSASPYDSFDFEVGDGSDFSTSDYTLTVNVTPVNDPPTGDNNTVVTNEDITYVFTVADFTVNYTDTGKRPFYAAPHHQPGVSRQPAIRRLTGGTQRCNYFRTISW